MIDLEDFIIKYHAQIDSGDTETLCELIEDNLSTDDAAEFINMLLEEDFDIIKHLKDIYPVSKIFNEFVFIEDFQESIYNDFIKPLSIPEDRDAKKFGRYLLKNYASTGFDIHNANSVNAGELVGDICALHIAPYLYENSVFALLCVEDEKAQSFELLKYFPNNTMLTFYGKIGYGCDPDNIDREFETLQKQMNEFVSKYNAESN